MNDVPVGDHRDPGCLFVVRPSNNCHQDAAWRCMSAGLKVAVCIRNFMEAELTGLYVLA